MSAAKRQVTWDLHAFCHQIHRLANNNHCADIPGVSLKIEVDSLCISSKFTLGEVCDTSLSSRIATVSFSMAFTVSALVAKLCLGFEIQRSLCFFFKQTFIQWQEDVFVIESAIFHIACPRNVSNFGDVLC